MPSIQLDDIKRRLECVSTKDQAFAEFYTLIVPRLSAWLSRQVSMEDAKDIIQDVFTKFWMLKSYASYVNLEKLVFQMAINLMRNNKKHAHYVATYQQMVQSLNDAKYNQQSAIDFKIDLSLATKGLSIRQEQCLSVWFLGASKEEVAKSLNLHYNTTWRHLHEALQKIREVIDPDTQPALPRGTK
jgi:RNA polymerase sigma-70 factor (ECF subfamily)